MFGKAKNKEKAIVVTTKNELEAAMSRKENCIEIRGDLARKMRWMSKLTPAKIAALTVLLAGCASNPVSSIALSAVSAITGTEIAVIFLSGAISISLIVSVFKGYSVEAQAGETSIRLIAK